VVAHGENIVGEGYHREAGLAHAEIAALGMAGSEAKGATAYVTLEPCNHHGRTPPCVDALLKVGIRRVIIGAIDPNPNVESGGVERLRAAGIEVVTGVLKDDAEKLIRPWRKYITQGVSYLSLKFGVSLDGRIASRSGETRWITSADARARVHSLRATHDAVCIGVSTVIADDPQLTVRDVDGRNPIRVVIDSKLRVPLTSKFVQTARAVASCVVTTEAAPKDVAERLTDAGVNIVVVPASPEGRCDVGATLKALAAREVVTVLCEGGAELAGSLLAGRLVDSLHMFVAPILLGPRGRPCAVDWAGPEGIGDAPHIKNPAWVLCGTDGYVSGEVVYPKKKQKPVA
jgi:diaminohydroxyphosphoribosylaminopyrimidine deaminase/5-amino-6-(5-phosphoribosylamino)uracil reductase